MSSTKKYSGVFLTDRNPYLNKDLTGGIAAKKERVDFAFSLRFFNSNFKYFQLGGLKDSWFVSLLTRLKQLSNENYAQFMQHGHMVNKGLRYHPINWSDDGIQVRKTDLDWIDSVYLENEEEYTFYQFSISRGRGRIIGFFDECHIFQIILFDPKHNMYPRKRDNYRMEITNPCQSEHEILSLKLSKIMDRVNEFSQKESCQTCKLIKNIRSEITNLNDDDFIHIHLMVDSDFNKALIALKEKEPNYFQEILDRSVYEKI